MTERDSKGRFAKGASGNPNGRPKRSKEEKFLEVMVGAVSLQDWREITKNAVIKAKRGDARARQWLSDYLLGKPVQKMEHSGQDGAALFGPGSIRIIVHGDDGDT